MALIACTECSKEISDQAAACPHCGAPRRPLPVKVHEPAKPLTQGASGCLIVLALLAIAVAISRCSGGDSQPLTGQQASPAIAAAPATLTAGKGWSEKGRQGMFHLVGVDADEATSEDFYRPIIASLCGGETHCGVIFWVGRENAASSMPMTDAQVATQAAAWTYNGDTGFRRLLWDCKRYPQADRDDCL